MMVLFFSVNGIADNRTSLTEPEKDNHLQYLITAIFTGAMQVADNILSLLHFPMIQTNQIHSEPRKKNSKNFEAIESDEMRE